MIDVQTRAGVVQQILNVICWLNFSCWCWRVKW